MKLPHGAFRWLLLASMGSAMIGCADDDVLQHGFVKLELRRSPSEETTPFDNTAIIVATMKYEGCLTTFYEENPNWGQTGVDGGPDFERYDAGGEGWMDRLCDDPYPGQVSCEVLEFDQEINLRQQLTVRYRIFDDAIEGRELPFGPLPTEELAGCTPVVSQGEGRQAVSGLDDGENRLWETSSFDPNMGATNQGGQLSVYAVRRDDA